MNVVLRRMVQTFELVTTDEPGEHWHNRGVAYAPAKGGIAVVRRRPAESTEGIEDAPLAA
jgi:hypothetical protein